MQKLKGNFVLTNVPRSERPVEAGKDRINCYNIVCTIFKLLGFIIHFSTNFKYIVAIESLYF